MVFNPRYIPGRLLLKVVYIVSIRITSNEYGQAFIGIQEQALPTQ